VCALPAGIIGARLYHVVTDYEIYTHNPLKALAIWDGGLGIPGGIAAGVIAGLIVAHRRGLPLPQVFDVVAPTLPASGQPDR
jgi:prolipoprotein diacylglyceryltransferase